MQFHLGDKKAIGLTNEIKYRFAFNVQIIRVGPGQWIQNEC